MPSAVCCYSFCWAAPTSTDPRFDGWTLNHAMPLFTNLTEEKVNAIYAYLRTTPVIDREIGRAEVEKSRHTSSVHQFSGSSVLLLKCRIIKNWLDY